jgi:hypothetical protein
MSRFDAGRFDNFLRPEWIGDGMTSRESPWIEGFAGRLDGFKEQIRSFITGTSSKRAVDDRTFDEAEVKHPSFGADLPLM